MTVNEQKYLIKNPENLASYYKKNIGIFILITIFGIIYNVGMILPPLFSGRMVDQIDNLNDSNSLSKLELLVIYFIVSTIVIQGIRALKRYYVRMFSVKCNIQMKLAFFNTVLSIDDEELENEKIGGILTKGLSDIESTVEGMRKLTTEIFDTLVVFVVYFIYLILFDYIITLTAISFIVLGVLFAFLVRKSVYKLSKDASLYFSSLSHYTLDNISNQSLYRRYGLEEENLKKYNDELKTYNKKMIKSNILQISIVPISYLISLVALIVIIIMASTKVLHNDDVFVKNEFLTGNTWTVGIFTTYLSTFLLFANKASHTANLFSTIQKGLASFSKVKPYLTSYKSYEHNIEVKKSDFINFDNYSLSIGDKKILENFTFNMKLGETILINAKIASGKTTFAKSFLNKFPYTGKLSVFGKELEDYSRKEIDGTISLISHKDYVFSDTLAENILLGREGDVQEELHEVLLDEDLSSFENKEETNLQIDGNNISTGQNKRLAIAREFLYPKRLMILDEVFSSIDSSDAIKILSKLKDKCHKSSIILVISSHTELESLADNVITILDDGKYKIGK